MLIADFVTAGVIDDVAQKVQMPIGPQTLDDVEESMPARPATLKDPVTPDQIELDQQSVTHSRVSHDARCTSNLEAVIHLIENSRKSTQLRLNFREAVCRMRLSACDQTPLLQPYTRRWSQIPKKMDRPHAVVGTATYTTIRWFDPLALHG